MKILLQFPEGLKQKALELAKQYEKQGHEIYFSASACYGACDIALDEARAIGADRIVHVGHNRFVKKHLPIEVEYIDYPLDVDTNALKLLLPYIENYKAIALATTVQHIHQFDQMKQFFEENGKQVFAAEGEHAPKTGQILGCDALAVKKVADKVEAVVFVGSGMFHPLAIDLGKPVFVYNPASKQAKEITGEIEKLRKKRKGAVAAALNCKNFGILVSSKVGQFNMVHAKWAKQELVNRNLKAEILVANELEPLTINNFMVFDCYINTACPRLSDDSEEFGKPVLSIDMLKELLAIMG